ncbi:MAG: hypothetical protein AB3N20_10175 [Rhizobiaceae bacterium]
MPILPKPVRSLVALITLVLPFPGQAADKDFCPAIEKLGALAQNSFVIAPTPADVEPLFTVAKNPVVQPDCRLFTKSGGKSHMCMWTFEYRDQHATAGFTALLGRIKQCLGSSASESMDTGVNHPDSYEARYFELDGFRFTVSIKDKAPLQKSFVFFWVDKAENTP